MTKPHDIQSALEQFLDGADPAAVAVVDWPGRPGKKVGLRVLMDHEVATAEREARSLCIAAGLASDSWRDWRDVFSRYFVSELVAAALVDPGSGRSICPGGGDELRKKAKRETIMILGAALQSHIEQHAPVPASLSTPEELAAFEERLLEAVGKGLGATLLEHVDRSSLENLLLYTVAQRNKSTATT